MSNKAKGILGVILIILGLLGTLHLKTLYEDILLPEELDGIGAEDMNAEVDPETQLPTEPPTEEPTEKKYPELSEEDAWMLTLVNPWTFMEEGYAPELKLLPDGVRYVDARIYDDLMEMLDAGEAEGMDIAVCSAYREHTTQVSLYNNKIQRLKNEGYGEEEAIKEAGRWVAVPGTSEHQLGLAVDLVDNSYWVLDETQEEREEQKWLMANSWKYGFILRYPSDKSDITGIGYEPWHYRYVGKETAAAVYESGLCFEEYLQVLEAQK